MSQKLPLLIRRLAVLLVVLALAIAACNNEDDNELEVDVGSTGITVVA
jgi:hypothetical protein